MAGDKRTPAQRAADRERIAELRLKEWTVPMICRELKLSPSTVARELRSLIEEWKQKAAEDIAAVKARELRKLDRMEAEATRAWERSLQDYTRRVVSEKPGARQKPVKGKASQPTTDRSASVETGSQNGDPRFLRIILDCQERRAKMLGTDAPTKVAPTDPTGEQPYKPMTDAELDARIRELAAKVGAPEGASAHGGA